MNFKYIYLILVFNLFCCSNVSASISCKEEQSKIWVIVNNNSKIIGSSDGFGLQSLCESFLPSNSEDKVICSWNGNHYQFYDVETGTPIGATALNQNYPPNSYQQCINQAAQQPKSSNIVCAWNGKYYAPFNRNTGSQLSGPGNGYDLMETCLGYLQHTVQEHSICSWNYGATLYSLNGKQLSISFKNFDECKGYQSLVESLTNKSSLIEKMDNYDFSKIETSKPTPINSDTPNSKVGFTFKNCGTKEYGYHLNKSKNGYIIPECQPDTLYEWGGFHKLLWFINNLPNGKPWPLQFDRTIYTTQSPFATFGYGRVPIRFKIKSNIKMKLFALKELWTCDLILKSNLIRKEEIFNTIFVRTEFRPGGISFQDYIICSPQVIESWSYLTEQHYDEILKDYNWARTHDFREWEGYVKRDGHDLNIGYDIDSTDYKTDFSDLSFNKRLNFLRLLIDSKMGAIHFPDSAIQSSEQHFKTSHPIYFNP